MTPQTVTDEEVYFGADITRVHKLLPPPEAVPAHLRDHSDPAHEFVSHWFFEGISGHQEQFQVLGGFDKNLALRHMSAIMRSWACSHGDKISGVAYLLTLWFQPLAGDQKKAG